VSHVLGADRDGTRAFMRRELFDPLGMKTADPHFDAAGHFIGASYCPCSARDFARFGLLYLRDGSWDGRRILPEGWVDYSRTPSPQSDGLYGAHFWVTPGSLGIFSCQGAWGQRILIVPKLDLVVVRLGRTAPHKVGAVVQYCKALVDAFRPTAAGAPAATT
jgi:CubicO group peptidase (beta-lactamase class C family)